MRIMHIISSPTAGGAEVFVKDMILNFADGYEFSVLFLNNSSDAGRDQYFEDNFLQELRDNNVPFDFLGNSARWNPVSGFVKMLKVIRKFKPDLIHSHLVYGTLYTLLVCKFRCSVYTHHNIRVQHPIILKILGVAIRRAVAISVKCQHELNKHISENKIKLIYNGVNLTRIYGNTRLAEVDRSDTVTILMVGSITEQKNYSFALNVFSRLKCSKKRLLIAGEGSHLDLLKRQVETLDIGNEVQFLGNVLDMPSLYSQASIFMMTSSWEGLPIALLEATMAELPVIVTDVGGCAEVVNAVGNGYVVEADNIEMYLSRLSGLVDSYSLRESLRQNARKSKAKFAISASVTAHKDLYDEMGNS